MAIDPHIHGAMTAPNLSNRVRDLLRDRHWSQAHLAQASGLQPSIVSRLLAGSRPWKSEHVARVAAALSMSPDELTSGTEAALDRPGQVDAQFVATLTKDHGALIGENRRLAEELAAIKEQLQRIVEEGDRLRLRIGRESRLRTTAESELRAVRQQHTAIESQNRSLRREQALMTASLDTTRRQLAVVQAEHANAAQIANQNYATAMELQRKLSNTAGVAAVTGLFGLAMVVSKALGGDDKPTKGGRRRGK